ncbi:MAG TPA: hypothetical protein VK564_04645 [Thermodesulfobacteriota bacterium]|nr:hypothetical protein [Thermodesulfobacteriota bacterium]
MRNLFREQNKLFRKLLWGFLFLILLLFPMSRVWSQGMTYQSILVKDLNRLTPTTSFSKSDKIYLYSTWSGLTGNHEMKVLWIRPDNRIQETTRLKVNIHPKAQTYTTWAWLSFKKGLLDFMSSDAQFIGPWKARLFLDDTFLKEYTFTVL